MGENGIDAETAKKIITLPLLHFSYMPSTLDYLIP